MSLLALNIESFKRNTSYRTESATGLTDTVVVLRSTAAGACAVETWRHHCDTSATPRQSAILHAIQTIIPGFNCDGNLKLSSVVLVRLYSNFFQAACRDISMGGGPPYLRGLTRTISQKQTNISKFVMIKLEFKYILEKRVLPQNKNF